MKAESIKLFDFLEPNKLILDIPIYQRNYEWKEAQCHQLFNDIENIIKYNKKSHFLGTIVYISQEGPQTSRIYTIVDGQQRLTSCSLLLKALANEINDHNSYDEIMEYLINRRFEENNSMKLRPVNKDKQSYYSCIYDKACDELSKITDNYELFKEYIRCSGYSAKEIFEAMKKLTIVYISLDTNNSENPQVIFESLNSTGLDLEVSDLIRNYLLMKLQYKKQEELYNNYWQKIENLLPGNNFSEFIRSYLISVQAKKVTKKNVYKEYKTYYNYKFNSVEDALKEMYLYANHYYQLLNSKTNYKQINKIIKGINYMKQKVVYPYFLKILYLLDKNYLSYDDANEISEYIFSFLYRRLICKIPTNSLNNIVIKLLHAPQQNELKCAQKILYNSNFPNNKELSKALISTSLYNEGDRQKAMIALCSIENYLSKEIVDFDNIEIEHIMPQTLNNDWFLYLKNAENINLEYGNTLGNLTLTKYNPELSNHYFTDKKKIYKESNIYITRKLEKYNEWTKDTIIERAEWMIEILCNKILKYPESIILESTDNIDTNLEHNVSERIIVTGYTPIKLIIEEVEYPVSSWKNMLDTFLNYCWEYDSAIFKKLPQTPGLTNLFNINKDTSPHVTINGQYNAQRIISIINKISEIYGIEDQVRYSIK